MIDWRNVFLDANRVVGLALDRIPYGSINRRREYCRGIKAWLARLGTLMAILGAPIR
jgi:hypothetical protein